MSKALTYEIIAGVLKNNIKYADNESERETIEIVAEEMAIAFKDNDIHFNREHFLKECGLK